VGDRTPIEWTDASWTPIRARNAAGKLGWHCEHASAGCVNCYAASMNLRLGTRLPFKPGHRKDGDIELILDEKMLLAPLHWKRPRMIFVNSMTDTFADFVSDCWLWRMFAVMEACPQHTFQVLTKRSVRMRQFMPSAGPFVRKAAIDTMVQHYRGLSQWPPSNVWLGVSCESQDWADKRIPDLLATPAAVRFVSLEPLLGAIDLTPWLKHYTFPLHNNRDGTGRYEKAILDWVIVGGESGPDARPMHPQWARDLRDQCQADGVAYFFKQWGEFAPTRITLRSFQNPQPERFGEAAVAYDGDHVIVLRRWGKARAGRLLDAREWNELPRVGGRPGGSDPVAAPAEAP
jgi:protein gp37